jgi:pimeloyl-ACP methyl ester carboxylesterase
MAATEPSSEPPPFHRRPLLIGVALIVIIGAVLGVILAVTLGNDDTTSSKQDGSIGSPFSGDDDAVDASGATPATTQPGVEVSLVSPSFGPSFFPLEPSSTVVPASADPSAISSSSSAAPTITSSQTPTFLPSPQPTLIPQQHGEIVLGTTSNNIEYYHCHTSPPPSDSDAAVDNDKQIVLLHGSAFSKEIWRSTAGMLDQFCAGARTVVALDLPVSTNHLGLIQVLEALQQDALVQLPIDMLVTPSASGFTIVDWMRSGNNNNDNVQEASTMSNYLSTWVPVATGSLTSASDAQVTSLVGQVSVLAIHGNDDMAGGRYSNRLGELAQATVVELMGRHAVYLQSPDEFVQTILNY